jgi:hypothetical protein
MQSAPLATARRSKRTQPAHDIFDPHIPHLRVLSVLCQHFVAFDHRDQKARSLFRNQVAADCSRILPLSQSGGNAFLPSLEDSLQSLWYPSRSNSPRPMSGIHARRGRSMPCRRSAGISSPGDCRHRCPTDPGASTGGPIVSCFRRLSAHAFRPAPREAPRSCRIGSHRLRGRSRRRAGHFMRPRQSAKARAPPIVFFELVQNRIEADEVLQPSIAHDFLRSPHTCCHASNSLGLIW